MTFSAGELVSDKYQYYFLQSVLDCRPRLALSYQIIHGEITRLYYFLVGWNSPGREDNYFEKLGKFQLRRTSQLQSDGPYQHHGLLQILSRIFPHPRSVYI